jgi:hypothetical protein
LDRRLGGPQIWSGHGGEEKISQPLPGLKSLIIKPVPQHYATELSQLLDVHLKCYIETEESKLFMAVKLSY